MSDPTKAVFLSYAREDADAARRIAEALRSQRIEVWFDQAELRGGDAWDAKIKKQIRDCALFMPVVSAQTQERHEGYFRREWKLAVERTHDMAAGVAFIVPVVVDDTKEAEAAVPEEFMRVQWTRLPGALPSLQFAEQVKRLLEAPRKATTVTRTTVPAQPAAASEVGRALRARLLWIVGTTTVVLVGTLAWKLAHRNSDSGPLSESAARRSAPPTSEKSVSPPPAAQPPTDLAHAKSVAVLAFANMSADKDTEYFSDGVSEEILNALAHNPALRVAGRTSSFSFKGKNATNVEIGRALNVASVIEGSVRKSGNTVRITVQLINAADGYHVWSETFTREMTDIFALQDEIAAKVAQRLAGGSAGSTAPAVPASVAPTKNLAAYDAYLRGRALQTNAQSPQSRAEAVRLFEEAVRLDPGYALAWARVSQMGMRQRSSNFDRSDQTAAMSRSAATTALRLAPDLPEAHLAMAVVHYLVDFDFEAAQRELNTADRLRPNDAEVAATRARMEYTRGNWGEGLGALVARAVELDPQNSDSVMTLGQSLMVSGRFSEADRMFVRAWALSQESHSPIRVRAMNHWFWTGDVRGALLIMETIPENLRGESALFNNARARLHVSLGDIPAALADYQQVRFLTGKYEFQASGRQATSVAATYRMGWLEERLGHATRATQLYTEALEVGKQYAAEFPDLTDGASNLALIHVRRGERSEALAAIDLAMRIAARTRDVTQINQVRRAKAEVLLVLGETDAAIAELRALHEMGASSGYGFRLELEWEPLRANAKFQQLMKEAEARADAIPRPKK